MTLTIDVYSDVICPWCFVGKKRLEQALQSLPQPVEVKIQYHPFELNPNTPPEGWDRKKYLNEKYGDRIKEADKYLLELGKEAGIDFNFEKTKRIPNTFNAHRVLWLAEKEGLQAKAAEILFEAYFTEGKDLGDHQTLIELGVRAGLDREKLEKMLAGKEGTDAIRKAELKGHQEGIWAVPHFKIGDRTLSGAQDPAVLAQVILEEAQ